MEGIYIPYSNALYMIYSLIGTLVVNSGEELYKMDRDELRDLCGGRDGVRIYSQLQKDRPEVKIFNN